MVSALGASWYDTYHTHIYKYTPVLQLVRTAASTQQSNKMTLVSVGQDLLWSLISPVALIQSIYCVPNIATDIQV